MFQSNEAEHPAQKYRWKVARITTVAEEPEDREMTTCNVGDCIRETG